RRARRPAGTRSRGRRRADRPRRRTRATAHPSCAAAGAMQRASGAQVEGERREPVGGQAKLRTATTADHPQLPLEEGAGEGSIDMEVGKTDVDFDRLTRVRLQEHDEVVPAAGALDGNDLDVLAVKETEAAA